MCLERLNKNHTHTRHESIIKGTEKEGPKVMSWFILFYFFNGVERMPRNTTCSKALPPGPPEA